VALREIDIFTSLTPDEAHGAICRVVRPPLAWAEYFIRRDPRQPNHPFHGTVDSRTFKVTARHRIQEQLPAGHSR
jgi:hypothetical protein